MQIRFGLAKKQETCIELSTGIKQLCKKKSIKQINIFFGFLGGYHKEVRKGLSTASNSGKELSFFNERHLASVLWRFVVFSTLQTRQL